MVKLTDNYKINQATFKAAGIMVPKYFQEEITKNSINSPRWVHFGGGNLFRCFHAKIAQDLLNQNLMDSGVIVAETYDEEVIEKIYQGYGNRMLSVTMSEDGSLDKELIASVADAIYVDQDGLKKLIAVFKNPSLQFITMSITEKGYTVKDIQGQLTDQAQHDIEAGPNGGLKSNMGIIAKLLYERYLAGEYPIAMVSTDNFSENGKRFRNNVMEIVNGWLSRGSVSRDFEAYLNDDNKVTFPWSMIDRITPNPAQVVAERLQSDSFEDTKILHTKKHTNIAPFGNTEEVHYLVIEDSFPNGRPALDKAGVILTDRATVNDADQMKVTACLNPLHTALAIFGNLLGYQAIWAEMQDQDLKNLVMNLGYGENLPVVIDPKIINPKEFIDELLNKRLPNKNIPDTPQRIASDTSQKLPIRYGVTISHYISDSAKDVTKLEFIPLIIAGWCRYLLAVDDEGKIFTPSPDPLLAEMQAYVADIKLGEETDVHAKLVDVLSNTTIFGFNLYEIGLGEKVEAYFRAMITGPGAVRQVLQKTNADKGYKF
ncbi:mannitol dehydrogenase family protein [Ligilactobacillus equi]|uniref:mannitol dehydrogenase family protein n=1 Tax=Ligilactobacillus equi TaxID=137357 RepID=UPI002ED2804F